MLIYCHYIYISQHLLCIQCVLNPVLNILYRTSHLTLTHKSEKGGMVISILWMWTINSEHEALWLPLHALTFGNLWPKHCGNLEREKGHPARRIKVRR